MNKILFDKCDSGNVFLFTFLAYLAVNKIFSLSLLFDKRLNTIHIVVTRDKSFM